MYKRVRLVFLYLMYLIGWMDRERLILSPALIAVVTFSFYDIS